MGEARDDATLVKGIFSSVWIPTQEDIFFHGDYEGWILETFLSHKARKVLGLGKGKSSVGEIVSHFPEATVSKDEEGYDCYTLPLKEKTFTLKRYGRLSIESGYGNTRLSDLKASDGARLLRIMGSNWSVAAEIVRETLIQSETEKKCREIRTLTLQSLVPAILKKGGYDIYDLDVGQDSIGLRVKISPTKYAELSLGNELFLGLSDSLIPCLDALRDIEALTGDRLFKERF